MKIKGFTLVEMLLAMALTGVVVSLAWFVFGHFHQAGSNFQKRGQRGSELSLLHFALLQDSKAARQYQVQGASLILFDAYSDTLASYSRRDSSILRKTSSIEEFKLLGLKISGGTPESFVLEDSIQGHRLIYRVQSRRRAKAQ